MGNKLGRRRQVVDVKYTKPQGLYQHKNVDHKKLRKLILDSKLAPCYPGDDDCGGDLEECPICFLYYPSLNRSRCCLKGICTECFLQMKTPNSTQPTQCPFCKTSNYAVEYRGVKTKEEKGLEQLEEQRVIEAKIRIRQQELQDEEERMLKRREMSSSSMRAPAEIDCCSTRAQSFVSAVEEIASLHELESVRPPLPPRPRQNREDEFDLDLEDIMVMEAIWLSIQENGRQQDLPYSDASHSAAYTVEDCRSLSSMAPLHGSSAASSPSGGLACAVAALAECQQIGETSNNYGGAMPTCNMSGCSRYSNFEEEESENYFPAESGIPSPDSHATMMTDAGEWMDHRSVVAEVGTSYAGSDEFNNAVGHTTHPYQCENQCNLQSVTSPIVPESFEEQMMLAMAVSLAEARVRTNTPGVAWQ